MAENVVSCATCGNTNSVNAAFCIHCRAPLAPGSQASDSSSAGVAAGGAAATPPPAGAASPQPGYVPPQPSSSSPPPPPPQGANATGSRPQQPTPSYIVKEHPHSLTQRGVLSSLFDVTFTSLIGTKLVRVLYVLTMVWIGLTALFYIFLGFHTSPIAGLAVLFIFAPLISLILLGVTRLAFEVYIAIFQLMANTNELVAQGRDPSV